MAHGGIRPGAGRKSGAPDKVKAARETVDRHAEAVSGIVPPEIAAMSPLDVMLRAMALKAAAGDWKAASDHAALAAPYIHPRLSVATNVNLSADDLGTLSDDDLRSELARIGGAGATAGARTETA